MMNFLTNLWDPDWSQFWPSMVATFFGVIAAIVVQRIYEGHKDKKEAKDLKEKVFAELDKVRKELIKKANDKERKLQLNPIQTPVFQGLKDSAKLSLLSRYIWYDKLIDIYNSLDIYNAWYNYRTNNLDSNSEIVKFFMCIEGALIGKSPDQFNVVGNANDKIYNFVSKSYEKIACSKCGHCPILINKEMSGLFGEIHCLLIMMGSNSNKYVRNSLIGRLRRLILKKRAKRAIKAEGEQNV